MNEDATEKTDVHESDMGIQAFDVTPKAESENTAPQAPANPFDEIIEQQKASIDALMEQNRNLTEQVTRLIENGAQIKHDGKADNSETAANNPKMQAGQYAPVYGAGENPLSQLNTPALSDDTDYSLEALASEIGKR